MQYAKARRYAKPLIYLDKAQQPRPKSFEKPNEHKVPHPHHRMTKPPTRPSHLPHGQKPADCQGKKKPTHRVG
jgi:hypothetical protein